MNVRDHPGRSSRPALRPRGIVHAATVATLLLAGATPLAAQAVAAMHHVTPGVRDRAPAALHLEDVGSSLARRDRPAATRGQYMVAGGLIGLTVGALYAGSRLPSHVDGIRDPVFLAPLSGALLGAVAGAIVYSVR